MKSVFEVNGYAKPEGGKFDSFRDVNICPDDFNLVDEMLTSPTANKARRLRLFYENIRKPKADFYKIDRGQFVCTKRAYDVLLRIKSLGAQLFPVSIEGEAEPHYLFIPTRIGSFLDPKNSVWQHWQQTQTTASDQISSLKPVIVFEAFNADRVPTVGVFRESEDAAKRVFCTESSGSYDNEFKAVVEHRGLLGLRFELVWTEKIGPVLPKWGPTMPGDVWKTGDGRVIRENKAPIPKPRAVVAKIAILPKPAKEKKSQLRVYQLGFQDNLRLIPQSSQALSFDGRPINKSRMALMMAFAKGKARKADFFPVGEGAFVCSDRAQTECAPLEDEGQFLPAKIAGLPGKFFLYNSTNCLNCLDLKTTKWKSGIKQGIRGSIVRPAFRSERFGEVCLLKLAEENGSNLYCVERTGDRYDGEFKALVENAGLTGVTFKKVWSGGR